MLKKISINKDISTSKTMPSFYYLDDVLKDHPQLKAVQRVTLRSSLRSIKFSLWDENKKKMVSFSEARKHL